MTTVAIKLLLTATLRKDKVELNVEDRRDVEYERFGRACASLLNRISDASERRRLVLLERHVF